MAAMLQSLTVVLTVNFVQYLCMLEHNLDTEWSALNKRLFLTNMYKTYQIQLQQTLYHATTMVLSPSLKPFPFEKLEPIVGAL